MPTESETRYLVLGGGLAMPVEPWLLILQLESKGLTLSRDGDQILLRPARCLSTTDREAVQRWRDHVLALIDYVHHVQ